MLFSSEWIEGISCLSSLALALAVINTSSSNSASGSKRVLTPEEALSFRSVSDAQISPDGTQVAFVLGDAFTFDSKFPKSQIWFVCTDGSKLRPMTSGLRSNSLPRWSPDGRVLAFASDRIQDGQKQIYCIATEGGEAWALTDIKGSIPTPRGLNSLQWSPDGRYLAFLKEDPETLEERFRAEQKDDSIEFERHHKFIRLWIVEVASQQLRCASPEGLQVWEFAWSPDSQHFVAAVSDFPYEWSWYTNRLVRFPAGGTAETLYHRRRQVALPRWSPDGRTVAFLSSNWSDRGVTAGDVHLVSAEGGEARNLTAGREGSFSWMEWQPGSQSLLAMAHERGGMSLWEVSSIKSGTVQSLWWGEVTFAEPFWPRFSASRSFSPLAMVREDNAHPRDIWIMSSGNPPAWKQLTHLHHQAEEIEVAPAESIYWKGADGWQMQGILVNPVGYQPGKRYPMVTWVHGGPTSASTFRYGVEGYVQLLAARGIAVFLPNYRGSVGWGLGFAESNIGDMGGKDFQDIMAGVDYCVEQGIADANRLGIGGWSYGGFMTAWAVSQTDRFRAAVMGAGISNWLSFHGNSVLSDWDAIHFNADPYEPDGVYQRFSPINYVKQIKTPTLILHGEKDGDVPPEQSYQFFRALKDHKVKAALVIYPREGHAPNEKMHLLDLARRIPAWFEEYLGH